MKKTQDRYRFIPGLLLPAVVLSVSLFSAGCGPSAEKRANLTAQSLTDQAKTFLEGDLIDEAENCAKKAIATPKASNTEEAQAILDKIVALKYQRAWKRAQRELQPIFDEALGLLEAGKPEAATALLAEAQSERTGAEADCLKQFSDTVRAAIDKSRARLLWQSFDVPALEKFQEEDVLPKTIWIESWGPPLENPVLLATWKRTLTDVLPEVIEQAEKEAAQAVPQSPAGLFDTNLTVPMEEVSANPENWYGKRIYFNNAWVRGGVKRDPGHGYTLSVISPNNNRFPAKVTGEKMIFVVPGSMAKELNALVSADSKLEVKLYAKIERGKIAVLEGQRKFPRASVYWIGVLSNGKVQKILSRR